VPIEPDSGSPLQRHINETEEIVLPYAENVISFEFAALHFAHSENNLYTYRMEGFDQDWVDAGGKRDVTYTNLDPGTYTFRVRGSNSDGVWNDEGATLRLIIMPPWWQTWWFRLASLGSLVALIWGGHQTRLRVVEAQRQKLARQVADQTREISDRKVEAELLHRAAEITAETDSFDEALQQILEIVCEMTRWPVGHVYEPSPAEADLLVPTTIWYLADPEKYAVFREVTERTNFTIGVGLPGRILESHEPAWITSLKADPNFPRVKLAKDLKVKGAFGFPVEVAGKIVAVLEFFADEETPPDEDLLMFVRNLGGQLGRVFERKRAEEAIRNSEKMAALGHLIAGVAHEVNTPLGAIRSSVGNISGILDQLLASLPNFFQILSEDEQRLFFRLLETSSQGGDLLSAKDARKARRTMVRQLEELDIEDADEVGDTLVLSSSSRTG